MASFWIFFDPEGDVEENNAFRNPKLLDVIQVNNLIVTRLLYGCVIVRDVMRRYTEPYP